MARSGFRGQNSWISALPLIALTGVLGVIALATLMGANAQDARMRNQLFDYFQRLNAGSYDIGDEYHVVTIDRESVDKIGPWPWPRTVLAELVTEISAAGAKGVVITHTLDSPDPLSPETIGAFWLQGASDDPLAQQLAILPKTDEVLANAFARGNGAFGVSENPPESPWRATAIARSDVAGSAWLTLTGTETDYLALPTSRYLYTIDTNLLDAATPSIAAAAADPDGIVRRLPLLWSLENKPAPAIALEAARLAKSTALVTIAADSATGRAQGATVKSISLSDDVNLRVANNSAIRLHLPKRVNAPTTSAASILTGSVSESLFRDSVVLIGLDSEFAPPIQTARGPISQPVFHALVSAQISAGVAPYRPMWAGYLEAFAVMVLGAAAIMVAQRILFWQAVVFAAGLSLLLILGAFFTLSGNGVLIDPLAPSLGLFVGALSVAGGRSISGVLRDDSFRGSFHDTLPESAMSKLRDENAGQILNGAYRPLTVLACELRFVDDDLNTLTRKSEDVTNILAAASLELRQTILHAGGAADQAEGGRIFAYFNAPTELADHIQAGCAAALRLVESMDKINADLEASSSLRNVQVHLAIGVASGECFVGAMGHGRNNRYSAVGPAVDRATLLRNQSEHYGPAMICDEEVYKETHHQFAYLEVDRVRVRQSEKPFSIYALIGNPFIKSSKSFRELDDAHRDMLTAYRKGDMQKAKTLLETVRRSPGSNIELFDIYEERINANLEKALGDDWSGVTDILA